MTKLNIQKHSSKASKKAKRPGRPPTGQDPAKSPRSHSQRPVPTAASPARKQTKRDKLAALLVRDEGASLDQMIAATGWLPHTTRAALTGLRKAGYAVDSDKVEGVRTYRAVAPR